MPRRTGSPLMNAAMLAMEAQQVIGLRMWKLALGGSAAETEMRQMVEEKLTATATATTLMTAAALQGRSDGADDVVRMLRKKVRANRKRLSTPKA
ncbi:MAG: hypothetical protein RQ966_00570 [Acetobacteraceae bacterium]|nr:hypothetical protein [Acetobacteraceae bacterium]